MTDANRPMRVLYIARAPFISGAERALESMLRHLDRTRVQPGLVVGTQTPLVDTARSLEIPVAVFPLAKRSAGTLLGYWKSLARLRRMIRRFKPVLMHANDVPSCQAMSEVGGDVGLPRVIHVRWPVSAEEASWWARRGAEAVVCISQWVREQLGEVDDTPLEDARMEVLADCVDWPADKSKSGEAPHVHAGLRGGKDATIGFAGQLIESKGLDLVIEAMGKLPADDRPTLLVAGEDTQTKGAYKRHLQGLAERSGVARNVQWLGFLDDVGTLHRRVSAMVCPSRIEPLGLVPLEAARYAVPTLANRVGGLAETIEDGVSGRLVEPTVHAWAQALKSLNDRESLARMGKAAHERTRLRYSPAAYQDRLMQLYESLLG